MATSHAASSASHPADGGADLVVEITCGRARAVTRRTHVVGARGEDVAVLVGRERPQHQVLARARRLLAHVKLSWVFRSSSSCGDPAPRDLGEPVERQPEHRFGSDQRRAEHRGDRLDGGVVILGFHDDVEHLVPPFERADQRVGDLPACDLCVVVGHGVKRNQQRCATLSRAGRSRMCRPRRNRCARRSRGRRC